MKESGKMWSDTKIRKKQMSISKFNYVENIETLAFSNACSTFMEIRQWM